MCESDSQLLAFFPFQVFGKVEIENRGKGDEDFRQRERRERARVVCLFTRKEVRGAVGLYVGKGLVLGLKLWIFSVLPLSRQQLHLDRHTVLAEQSVRRIVIAVV